MSSHDNERRTQTSVTTTTETQTVEEGRDLNVLSPLEEKVLRMLHGMSEEDAHQLKFALGADDELRARLALLEHTLIELFEAEQLDESIMEQVRSITAGMRD